MAAFCAPAAPTINKVFMGFSILGLKNACFCFFKFGAFQYLVLGHLSRVARVMTTTFLASERMKFILMQPVSRTKKPVRSLSIFKIMEA